MESRSLFKLLLSTVIFPGLVCVIAAPGGLRWRCFPLTPPTVLRLYPPSLASQASKTHKNRGRQIAYYYGDTAHSTLFLRFSLLQLRTKHTNINVDCLLNLPNLRKRNMLPFVVYVLLHQPSLLNIRTEGIINLININLVAKYITNQYIIRSI